MERPSKLLAIILMAALILSGCASAAQNASEGKGVEYALTSGIIDGKFTYIGVGGGIDGVSNPVLSANVGDTVKITLTSGDGIEHDISFPDFNATSEHVVGQGSSVTLSFTVDKGGEFDYFCTIPGHREGGMEGKFSVAGGPVSGAQPTSSSNEHITVGGPVVVDNPPTIGGDVVRDPTDLPAPPPIRDPEIVPIDLEAVEIEGQLADGTTFSYWTFNGKVPGPFFRVRMGDTIEVHMNNLTNSTMAHSVDFHAVTGPGGGAGMSQTAPGDETMFSAMALKRGLYVYHGAVGSLTTQKPLKANVGETVRIFFGVGGPNFTSSFHVIGKIFDRVFNQASLTSPALTNIQTTLVPPGEATVVEFGLEVPGTYLLVDHALSRMQRGLVVYLIAEGPENPEIFNGTLMPGSGHQTSCNSG